MTMTTFFARTEGYNKDELQHIEFTTQPSNIHTIEIKVKHGQYLTIHTDLGGLRAMRNACDEGIETLWAQQVSEAKEGV